MAAKSEITYVIAHARASYRLLKAEASSVDAKLLATYQDISAVEVKLDADTLNRYFRTDQVVMTDVFTIVHQRAFEETVGTGDSTTIISGKALAESLSYGGNGSSVY